MLRPYRIKMTVAILLALVSAGTALAQPLVIGQVVTAAIEQYSVLGPFLVLVGLFVLDAVVAVVNVYLLGKVGTSVTLDVRRSVVRKLLRATVETHKQHQRGDIFAGAVSDTGLLKGSLSQGLFGIGSSGVVVLGAIGFMFFIDPILTLSTMSILVLVSAVAVVISGRLRTAVKVSRDRVGDFGAALERALGAVRTVKISRAEDREQQRLDDCATRAYSAAMRGVRFESALAPVVNLGIQASFAAVFIIGGFRISAGSLDTGAFAAYVLYLLYLISPLVNLLNGVTQLQRGGASVLRLTGLLSIPEEQSVTRAEPGQSEYTHDYDSLVFEGVSFGYLPDHPVLEDVSFRVPRRGLIAIVGPSGAGKSTLFSLLERFWSPDSGVVRVDGVNIDSIPLDLLRAKIGYVEQDSPAVDGTIRENLNFANPVATREEVEEVIDKANLRDWVESLPRGLDTEVGELGDSISGGERQRIAIARMLLARPDILLLDEVTSQLDSDTESAMRNCMLAEASQRAVVTIAHRMSTVVKADHILVMEGGRVRAAGHHKSLMASDDLYRRLVRGQGEFSFAAENDLKEVSAEWGSVTTPAR